MLPGRANLFYRSPMPLLHSLVLAYTNDAYFESDSIVSLTEKENFLLR
jgi:predicted lipase